MPGRSELETGGSLRYLFHSPGLWVAVGQGVPLQPIGTLPTALSVSKVGNLLLPLVPESLDDDNIAPFPAPKCPTVPCDFPIVSPQLCSLPLYKTALVLFGCLTHIRWHIPQQIALAPQTRNWKQDVMETQEDSLEGCWWTAANSSYSCWERCLPSSQWPSFWRHWPQFTGVCPGTCVTSQVYFSHMTKGSHMTQYGSVRSFSWKLGQWIQRPIAELYNQLWEKQEKEGTEGRGSNTQGSSR